MFELEAIDLFAIVPGTPVLNDNITVEVKSYDYTSAPEQHRAEQVRQEQQKALDRKVVDVESLNRVCTV